MLKSNHLHYLNLCGSISLPWLALNVILFASLQIEYSHILNYVSELGAVAARYSLFMNFFGFIVTGVLIVLAGVGVGYSLKQMNINHYVAFAMVGFGLMFCLVAIPMDYNRDYHRFFALYALVPFYLAVFFAALLAFKLPIKTPYKVLIYILSFAIFLDAVIPLDLPIGLYQRMTLFLVFGWFSLFSSLVFFSYLQHRESLNLIK